MIKKVLVALIFITILSINQQLVTIMAENQSALTILNVLANVEMKTINIAGQLTNPRAVHLVTVAIYPAGDNFNDINNVLYIEQVQVTCDTNNKFNLSLNFDTDFGEGLLAVRIGGYDIHIPDTFEFYYGTCLISTTAVDGGWALGSGKYYVNSNVILKAIPEDGYYFEGWYDNNVKVSETEETFAFAATADKVIEARFSRIPGVNIITADLSVLIDEDFGVVGPGYLQPDERSIMVTNNGGETISNITITLSGVGEDTFTLSDSSITNLAAGDSESFTVVPKVNLAAGAYTATVTITGPSNSISFDVYFIVVSFGLDAPTNVSATPGYSQVTITFAPPVNSGGSDVIDYTITAMPGNITATGTTSPIAVTGLTNGTEYTFTVTARTSIGSSIPSAPITATPYNPISTIAVRSEGNVTSIGVGDTLQMYTDIAPIDATYTTASWSVSPSDYAIIDSNGLLTATAAGTVTVKATAQDGSGAFGEYTVAINPTTLPPIVSSVTVTPNNVSIQKGNGYQFNATVNGTNNPSQEVIWSLSGNTSIGTIMNQSGLLTIAQDETATTLVVTATSSVDATKHGTAIVTVTTTPIVYHTLTVSSADGGTAYMDSGAVSGTYSQGDVINLVASPFSGYVFSHWASSNNGWFNNVHSATTTFTMPYNDTDITAYFTYVGYNEPEWEPDYQTTEPNPTQAPTPAPTISDSIASTIKDGKSTVTWTLTSSKTLVTLTNADISNLINNGITLIVKQGIVSVEITPDALVAATLNEAQKVEVSFSPLSNSQIKDLTKDLDEADTPLNKALLQNIYNITIKADGTEVKTFKTPLKLSYNLSKINIDTTQAKNLTIVRFINGKTQYLGDLYDSKTKVLTTETTSLSVYGVMSATDLRKLNMFIDSKNYTVNGTYMTADITPMIIDDRTMVPARFFAEAFGAGVDWNEKTRTVTISLDGRVLLIVIDQVLPGMDVPAQLINDRTMMPLRYISENLGINVIWDAGTKSIRAYK